jgi:diketogulonate reductase-like aldo/keto reductase
MSRAELTMKSLLLPSGRKMPVLGQGTWNMGEDPGARQREIGALQLGLDLGIGLVDTAEMYADGRAEEVVAAAIVGRREQVFLVSKVYPHHAGRRAVQDACERSLRRLGTDCLDLYLLHWRGSVPLDETLEGFEALQRSGKIRDYGVSNFDRDDMLEASRYAGGGGIATNQVLFNLARRGIEFELLPWCRERRVPVMAYSPLESSPAEQAGMLRNKKLLAVAERREASAAQVALAWLLHQDGVAVIPKAAQTRHVRENREALDIELTTQDLAELDQAFPPPRRRVPLDMR